MNERASGEVVRVGVVGCGLMGSGIAQVCAQAGGLPTIVREIDDPLLAQGRARVADFLAAGVERGKLSEETRRATLDRLEWTTDIADLHDCDLVIEAVTENRDVKVETFRDLDAACKPSTILASNTSSLSITEMAVGCGRPDRFIGLHFFNPVPLMQLVEVVHTLVSAPSVVESGRRFVSAIGKSPVLTKDRPGFIVNRLLVPYLLEAIRAYDEGLASAEDIDKAMQLGCGYPMGPLTLLDFVGLDTTYYIAQIMYDEFRAPHLAPPPLLKRMVLAGHHGRKSGRGFYDYPP